MGAPAYRLLSLDLDGTLTNSEKMVTPATKRAIRDAIGRGVQIVLASGRPLVGIKPVAETLALPELGGFVLAYNGGQIIDCRTWTVLFEKFLPEEAVPEICALARQQHLAALTYDSTGIVTEEPEARYVLLESYNNNIPIHPVAALDKAVTWRVPKLMVVGEPCLVREALPIFHEKFSGSLNVFLSEPYFIEVTPVGVEKAAAMTQLMQLLAIDKRAVMAVGDGLNDIPLLQAAGFAVAMGNAYEETKAVADYITASNDEDGVARAIKQFILI